MTGVPGRRSGGQTRPTAAAITACVLVLAWGVRAATVAPQGSPLAGPYGVEHGMIEFDISGPEPGTEILHFADHGLRQARTRTIHLMGEHGPQAAHTLIIDTPQWHYLIDLDAGRGTRAAVRSGAASDRQAAADLLWKAYGAEPQGKREIAGRSCERWVSVATGSETCIWQGLRLESRITAGAQTSWTRATHIDVETAVPDSRFTPPRHTVITDLQGDSLR